LRRALAPLSLAAALLAAAPARAEGDGVYGRLDGDLGLRLGAGVGFAAGGPGLAVEAGARYLSTAGMYVHYVDGLGSSGPRVRRSIAAGVDLAPIFLARYASNAEHGPAFFDLLLDSFAFGVGAFWDQQRMGPMASRPGVEISLAIAAPLVARASGPYLSLRGALRWRDDDLNGHPGGVSAIDRGAVLSLTLGWHHVVRAHLVDAGDGALR
jgi:hypothetical protein